VPKICVWEKKGKVNREKGGGTGGNCQKKGGKESLVTERSENRMVICEKTQKNAIFTRERRGIE